MDVQLGPIYYRIMGPKKRGPDAEPHPFTGDICYAAALLYKDLLQQHFKRSELWQMAGNGHSVMYCNRDEHSRLKNHLRIFPSSVLSHKTNCARLLNGKSYFMKSYLFESKKKPVRFDPEDLQGNDIWFYKPAIGSCGLGLQISKSLPHLWKVACREKVPGIFQRGQTDLDLVEDNKYEIRTFVVASYMGDKLSIFLYKEGHLNIAMSSYNKSENMNGSMVSRNNKRVMLTNRGFLNRKEIKRNRHQCLFTQLPHYHILYPKIRAVAADIGKVMYQQIQASKKSVKEKRMPQCEVFAFDFLIDKNHNPWVVELNRHPCVKLRKDVPSVQQLKKDFYHDLIEMVLEPFFLPMEPKMGNFDLVFHQDCGDIFANMPTQAEIRQAKRQEMRIKRQLKRRGQKNQVVEVVKKVDGSLETGEEAEEADIITFTPNYQYSEYREPETKLFNPSGSVPDNHMEVPLSQPSMSPAGIAVQKIPEMDLEL